MNKGKILLLNPPAPEIPPNYFGPPYGLSLVAASLLKNGRKVLAHDFDRVSLTDSLASIKKILGLENPRYVGLPIQSSTRGPVYQIVEKIKQIDPDIKIVLGGAFATTHYNMILKHFPVDLVVIGDGEYTTPELLDCLDEARDPSAIAGIAIRKNNRIIVPAKRPAERNLDRSPIPAFHLFDGFEKKINAPANGYKPPELISGERSTCAKNALLLLSSRGCVYNCNFCPMSTVSRDKIRFHSPEHFVGMVSHFYKKYRIRDFVFGDNFFTVNRNRAILICKEILRQKLDIRWNCMTRPDAVDKQLLAMMSKAGCYEISYGVESGSSKIQLSTGKKMDLERAKTGFKQTRQARIRSVLMLMVGNLGESKSTIDETLAYAQEVRSDNVLVKIARVYPGTKIHDIYEKRKGFDKNYYLKADPEPPIFSEPGTEDRIKDLYARIWPKTIAIEIHSHCNNNCLYCKKRKASSKSLHQLKGEVYLASLRAEYIRYCGGEPLLHKDFFKIAQYAKDIGIHHQQLYTNGRTLAYKGFAEKVTSCAHIEKVIIPFFGLADEHDRAVRVKNAFKQTLLGIRNLRDPGFLPLDIQANIVLTRENISATPQLIDALYSGGINAFHVIYGADSFGQVSLEAKDMPPLRASSRALRAIARQIEQKNGSLTFEGWPQCLTESLLEKAYEWHAPFDEIITIKPKVELCREIRKKNKIKSEACGSCKINHRCEGLWSSYLHAYGQNDITKR